MAKKTKKEDTDAKKTVGKGKKNTKVIINPTYNDLMERVIRRLKGE